MDTETFNGFSKEMLERIASNLKVKATTDYAVETDRLFNFHAAAPLLGSAEQACLAYATKHYMSIAKLVQDGKPVPKELALEKLGDLATYMVLLYAIMMERTDGDVGTRAE